jgi:hypothetical protein
VTPTPRSALAAASAAIAVATPRLAAACAVCMGGVGGGTQKAFATGSLFLSVLPLAVVGTAVWYLRRRAKAVEREANERRELRESSRPTSSLSSHG